MWHLDEFRLVSFPLRFLGGLWERWLTVAGRDTSAMLVNAYGQGETDRARKWLRQILSVDPEHRTARKILQATGDP